MFPHELHTVHWFVMSIVFPQWLFLLHFHHLHSPWLFTYSHQFTIFSNAYWIQVRLKQLVHCEFYLFFFAIIHFQLFILYLINYYIFVNKSHQTFLVISWTNLFNWIIILFFVNFLKLFNYFTSYFFQNLFSGF